MIARALYTLHLLSLDVVGGALVLLYFFSSYLGIAPSWTLYVLLGSNVWMIYTVDHLRDAAKSTLRPRYQIHQTHRRTLLFLLCLMASLIVSLLFFIETKVLIGGAVLGASSIGYLSTHEWLAKRGLKELYVALVYTTGILLVPYVMVDELPLTLFFLLLVLTYSNLILFSWYEHDEDVRDRFDSIATVWGVDKVERLLVLLLAIGLSVAFLMPFALLSFYFVIAFLTYFILLTGTRKGEWGPAFRIIGDGIFLVALFFTE